MTGKHANQSISRLFGTVINRLGILVLAGFAIAVIAGMVARQFAFPGAVILADLQHYCFATLILFGMISAYQGNHHVRAKVFSRLKGVSKTGRQAFRLWNLLLVILPLVVILAVSLPDIMSSWRILESSPQAGGLPGYFLVKSLLPVFCLVLVFLAMRNLLEKPDSES